MSIVETGTGGGGGGGGSSTPLDWKNSVRVATTANITLSGTQTIDSIAVVAGDRVLVKNQVTGANNGIYVVSAGAWSRADDANTSALVTSGLATYVEEGTANQRSVFILQTLNPITLGTTALVFAVYPSSGSGVTGSGSPPEVAYWATPTSLTSDSHFFYDDTNFILKLTNTGDTILSLATLSGTIGPSIDFDNSAQIGGLLWKIQATGGADVSGAGNLIFRDFSDALIPVTLQGVTGFVGINNTAPAFQLDVVGDAKVSARGAFGNSAAFGPDASDNYRHFQVGWNVTDFTAADFWLMESSYLTMVPDADYPAKFAAAKHVRIDFTDDGITPFDFGTVAGLAVLANSLSGGDLSGMVGADIETINNGAGTITEQYGTRTISRSVDGGATTTNTGAYIQTGCGGEGSGNITTNYSEFIAIPTNIGGIDNNYGLFIANQAGAGTLSYALYSDGGISYFKDAVGFGTATPLSAVDISGSLSLLVVNVPAGNYAVDLNDLIIDKTGISGGGDTVTLPDPALAGAGKIYIVKDSTGSAGTDNITVVSAAGLIDLGANYVISTNSGAVTFYCDGTDYRIIDAYGFSPTALDDRYANRYVFNYLGAYPTGTTAYFSTPGLSSTLVPIHLALENEIITSLNIIADTNGVTALDTYTVYVNGSPTAMVASITNSTAGSNTTPISISAGQSVAIQIVTDAATTGGNALVQLTIKKA